MLHEYRRRVSVARSARIGLYGGISLLTALVFGYLAISSGADNALGSMALQALVAFGALAVALSLLPPAPEPALAVPRGAGRSERARAGGVVGLAVVLVVATAVHLFITPVFDWSLLLFGAAAAIGWCGEVWLRGDSVRERLLHMARSTSHRRWDLLALLVLTIGSLGLRLWIDTSYPFLHGTQRSENGVGLLAWQMMHGTGPWPLYATEGNASAPFQPIALAFYWFGPSMHSMRVAIALMNAFAAPAFYVLARQCANVAIALCVAALLAFGYWPVTLGAFAFGYMVAATCQSLGLALLFYGLRRGSIVATAGAGAAMALCLYCYLSGRVMPFVAVPVLAIYLVRGPGTIRRRFSLCAAFIVGLAAAGSAWLGTVLSNTDLLHGDTQGLGQEFGAAIHASVFRAVGMVWGQMGRLLSTLLIGQRTGTYLAPDHGGVLDVITATLFLLAMGAIVLESWRPYNIVVLCGIVPPLLLASLVNQGQLDVYRLGSLIPALYLSIVLLLRRCQAIVTLVPHGTVAGLALLCVLDGAAGALNVTALNAHVHDNGYICAHTDFYVDVRAESVNLADLVNGLGTHQAVFLVTYEGGFGEGTDAVWLYHVPLPTIYNVRSPDPNPAHWSLLPESPPISGGTQHAVFWPPRLAPGQTALTYITIDNDAHIFDALAAFMPKVKRAYPGGRFYVLSPPGCPKFTLGVYTLTAGQLRAGHGGQARVVMGDRPVRTRTCPHGSHPGDAPWTGGRAANPLLAATRIVILEGTEIPTMTLYKEAA